MVNTANDGVNDRTTPTEREPETIDSGSRVTATLLARTAGVRAGETSVLA